MSLGRLRGQRNARGGKVGFDVPMKPECGAVNWGGAISRVKPHTTVVLPSLTRVDEGAVEIEPAVPPSRVSFASGEITTPHCQLGAHLCLCWPPSTSLIQCLRVACRRGVPMRR